MVYTPCGFSEEPIPNAKEKIMKNMFKHNVEELGVMITYNKDLKETTVSLEIEKSVIFCETFNGLGVDSFMCTMHRCIDAITTLDLTTSHITISPINDYRYAIGNKKCNIALLVIDTERKFMSSVIAIQKKGKHLKPGFLSVMTKGLITYDVTDYELSRVYDKCLKILK